MRSRSHGRWLLFWLAAPILSTSAGCASTFPQTIHARSMRFAAVPATVFVADGAGDFQMASKMLRTVAQKDGYPIDVITAAWSHGKRRILADLTDYPHSRSEGIHLAGRIQEYRHDHPERPIYLLGHSAGTTVILAALEHLPPGIVERAVLLSPSLSVSYDLRPSLRAVKQDLHVFYSERDTYFLGVVMHIIGTSDRLRTSAAGCIGFQPRIDAEEPELLHKLIQRPWHPMDHHLGNNGGHFGSYQPDFLRTHIMPLLNPPSGQHLE